MSFPTRFLLALGTAVLVASPSFANAPAWWSELGATSATAGTGLTGQYFDNEDLTVPVGPTRVDASINFNWGALSPLSGVNAGTYSVRWTGQIQPRYGEAYTFTTTSNDGVKVWIDNQLVIDHWASHEEADRSSAPITLTANQRYDIKIEFHQNAGPATLVLRWASASQAVEIVPTSALYPDGAAVPALRRDYNAANLGQVKNIAAKAVAEMNAKLPGGAGAELNALVAAWRQSPTDGTPRNDYAAVNQGQLKALAKKFYDRLAQVGYRNQPLSGEAVYPWTSGTSDDASFAAVNIGQVKNVFSFIPSLGNPLLDTDGDGISNGWERAHGLDPLSAADAVQVGTNSAWTNGAQANLTRTPTIDGSNEVGELPHALASEKTTLVGTTAGTLQVDKNGAATYSVPIWVVPGTAGMQPQLALNYSSQAGTGWLGYGWSLSGASAISRGPQTLAVDGAVHGVDFSGGDRYYLDGQRLVAISGADGEDGTEYRTEIDSVSKIVSYRSNESSRPGPDSFKVWTKAGLVIEFGTSADSAVEAVGRADHAISSWAVHRISDTKGNYMEFTYAEDSQLGEHRLTRIDYTGNAGASLSPYAYVQFNYEDRPDKFYGYAAGSRVARTQRLATIRSYHTIGTETTLAREYVLGYPASSVSGRSLLTSLTEKAGTNAYDPLVFEYEESTSSDIFQQTNNSKWGPPLPLAKEGATSRGTGFIDLNGDGRPDFVKYHRHPGSDTPLPPSQPPGTSGLSASYFHFSPPSDGSPPVNPFASAPVTSRVDPNVDSTQMWGADVPVAGVDATNFAVRWTGQVQPAYSGNYTFTTWSDDGVRLWVNGVLLVDNWTYHGNTPNSGSIELVAGQKYDLRMEYFQGIGGKVAVLEWESESTDPENYDYQPREVVPSSALFVASGGTGGTGTGLTGAYFNGQNFDSLVLTRTDSNIDMVWSASPADGVDADSFSVRWSGQIEPRYSETYTFIATTDDGVRLWINGQQIFPHDWTNHAPTAHSGTITLSAGQRYSIVMEFFENDSGASAKLEWQSASQAREVVPSTRLYPVDLTPSDAPGEGLLGTYYNGKNFETQILTRVDAMIDWSWGAAPAAGVNEDSFSVRWTGFVKPRYSGNYTFTTTADDGVALVVNGTTLFTDWNDHAPTANSGSIYLEAGRKYPIEMSYYENTGGASAKLEWQSDQQAREVVPSACLYSNANGAGTGLTGNYYSGLNFGSLLLTRVDSTIDFNWGPGAPAVSVPEQVFTVRWSGQVQPRYSESYTFITTSDDGVRLKINGQTVIDQWINHAATEHTGQITLVAGQKYNIELEYFEDIGDASVRLEWQSAQQTREVVPSSQLFPLGSSPTGGNTGGGSTTPPPVVSPNTNDVAAWINDPVSGWVFADGSVAGVPNFKLPAPLAQDGVTDTGSRFVDFNGDGRPDFFGRGNGSFQFYRHNGANWVPEAGWDLPLPAPPEGFDPATLDNLKNVTFLDLDGDGRVDLVGDAFYTYRDAGELEGPRTHHEMMAWRNTGGGWTIAQQWVPPLDLEQGTRFLDVNGDGLVDQVQHWYGYDVTIKAVALNTGNGWQLVYKQQTNDPDHNVNVNNGARFVPPDLLNTADPDYGKNSAIGAEIVDLNGDGLPDMITRNDTAGNLHNGVWFNTGNGWTSAPAELIGYGPPVGFAADHIPTGAAFLDVTGDGLVDVVYGNGNDRQTYPNTGHGWAGDSLSYHLVRQIRHANTPNVGVDFIDLDADGVVDQVWNYQDSSSPSGFRGVAFNKSRRTDRLIKVKNGFGVEASVEYALLTQRDESTGAYLVYDPATTMPDSDTFNVIGPMAVVSKVRNADGAGSTYDITYRYGGLRSHRVRGSQGFEWQRVTDGRTGIVSETHFKQAFPFTGMPANSTTKLNDGTMLSSSSMAYDKKTTGAGKVFLPFATQTTSNSYDLDGTFLSTTSTTVSDIDDYGNVKSMSVESTGGFKKTTTNRYDQDDTGKWFIGRLTKSTVTSEATGDAGGTLSSTRTSAFRYDSDTGLLTDEAVEPVLSDNQLLASATALAGYGVDTLRTTYEYDSFGNKRKVTVRGLRVNVGANGAVSSANSLESRSTETHYDARGRLPSDMTNALSHREDYLEYDEALGVLKKLRGANNLETSWEYDAVGRKTKESRSDGTATTIKTTWTSTLPAGAAFGNPYAAPTPAYCVETASTGAPPARTYFDSFGRAILSMTVNGDGNTIYQNTVYDNRSRSIAKSTPYLAGHTVYYATTEAFDLLDRPLITRTPADNTASSGTDAQGRPYSQTTFGYSGFVTSATDPQGRKTETEKNTQGWTVRNTRNVTAAGDAPASTVTYKYDAVGNLRETNAAGTVTTIAYDIRGRKLSMVDPDMGTWHYRYNAFGELIWQKDAKNQIVTLSYDALGRMTGRVEPEGATTWTYDSATGKGIGKLHTVSVSYTHAAGNTAAEPYSEIYTYDGYGRVYSVARSIVGETAPLVISQTYDSVGRPDITTYPESLGTVTNRFQVKNYYDAYGFLRAIRRAGTSNNEVYWVADSYDSAGRILHETYGNGLEVQHDYSEATGRLKRARVGVGAGNQIQFLDYTYDAVGNVLSRDDAATNRHEGFTYDGLDRLRTNTLSGAVTSSDSVSYFANGNIQTKSGVGTYDYTGYGPHAVASIAGTGSMAGRSFVYDAVGNQTYRMLGTTAERHQAWTSFNQVRRVERYEDAAGATKFAEFAFGAGHERVRQLSHLGTTTYVGSLFERFRPSGPGAVVEDKHYIYAPTGRIAVRIQRSDQTGETNWFHTDGLGSITGVTNAAGVVLQRFAFDAWGKRLNPATNGTITGTTSGGFTRGYTDHEQLDDLGLIHMNGRVYDPVLGRFLSADPNVDGVEDAQGFNRYSYVGNNPMNATDPSGFFKFSDALKIVAVVVVSVVTAGAALAAVGAAASWGAGISMVATAGFASAGAGFTAFQAAVIAGAAGGFASGFAGSLLNGGSIGDAFKAGVIGGVTGAVSAGIANKIGSFAKANGWFKGPLQHLSHGVAQGAISAATGGEFRHGFYAGFFTSAAAPYIQEALPGNVIAQTIAAAIVGGTASVVGGGKFANGAVSGAFTYLFNWATHVNDVHAIASRNVLSGKLSKRDLEILKRVSHELDENQDPSIQYKHAMRNGDSGQTVAEAEALANKYVRERFAAAWKYLASGDHDLAIAEFGRALHTLQDSTSPMHNYFKAWSSSDNAYVHGAQELTDPGASSRLYTATKAAYIWFSTGRIPEGNLFVFGHD